MRTNIPEGMEGQNMGEEWRTDICTAEGRDKCIRRTEIPTLEGRTVFVRKGGQTYMLKERRTYIYL